MMGTKRKFNEAELGNKRQEKGPERIPVAPDTSISPSHQPDASSNPTASSQPHRPRIRKLAPPRPFPTIPSASSLASPRSNHHEGKNHICITRKTKLAAYLRRCKSLLVVDGFRELKLSAMGAAIPHLALLAISLPPTLPWPDEKVRVDVFTGSVEVHDEVLSGSGSEEDHSPEEEFRTRVKSTMEVIIRIEGEGMSLVSKS